MVRASLACKAALLGNIVITAGIGRLMVDEGQNVNWVVHLPWGSG